jgi:hypothetical protein
MKNKFAIYSVLLVGLFLFILFNCKREEPKVAPIVATPTVSGITANTITCIVAIGMDGGSTITSKGVSWSTTLKSTTTDSTDNKTHNGGGSGSFTSVITGLSPGTTYNIQAYAINSVGTGYSSLLKATTLSTTPVLTTTALTAVTSISATGGGNITNDGGDSITARGVCWSTTQNPTVADSKTTDGKGKGSFTSSITGLAVGATYYIRAYATNSIGTSYGNQVTTTTISGSLPVITTSTASVLTTTTAACGGNITSDGGSPVTARGVCWRYSSITQLPTILDSKTTDGTGLGSFTSTLTVLSPNSFYTIRAYATNSSGTSYGSVVTLSITVPYLTILTTSGIASTTATIGSRITDDGGFAITARGVCWGTTQNPTISNSKTTDGTGTGNFTSLISGLNPGTTYYIRAYATNILGTGYSSDVTTIITASSIPVLTTKAVTAYTSSAKSGGDIISSGGGTYMCGICWSKNPNPTINDNKADVGNGLTNYQGSITGLDPNTTYYVRAYATNSMGTGYGNEISFKTNNLSIPSADYLPLQVGNYWELGDKVTTLTMLIDKIETLSGIDYYRLLLNHKDTLYFRKTADGKVYERGKSATEVLKFDFSVSQGDSWSYAIDPESTDALSARFPWNVTFQSKVDTVQRSNYTFQNCYRYYYDQVQEADEEYFWCLAPGIGFVKQTGTGWGISIRVKKVIINGVEIDY